MMYSINEIDAWKEGEGYTINDVYKTGIKIDIEPENTRQVFREIRRFYSLPIGRYTTNIKESGEGNLFEIVDRHTYEPILQLEKI